MYTQFVVKSGSKSNFLTLISIYLNAQGAPNLFPKLRFHTCALATRASNKEFRSDLTLIQKRSHPSDFRDLKVSSHATSLSKVGKSMRVKGLNSRLSKLSIVFCNGIRQKNYLLVSHSTNWKIIAFKKFTISELNHKKTTAPSGR